MPEDATGDSEVLKKARAAKAASYEMAKLDATARNAALCAMAGALCEATDYLLSENALDVKAARDGGTAEPLIDRLALDAARIDGIASTLRSLAGQADPIGSVIEGRTLYNGILMQKVRVPLGVVAMIYEARPNVTADAAGLALKSANACILRGGSLAIHSNLAMTKVLYDASIGAGMPSNWLQSIETTSRDATTELMGLHGLIDVLIPRGSAGLINSVVQNAKVPVIETGAGNCHVYIHEAANTDMIAPIVMNAKTQRPGVCNACESLLVDASVAPSALPPVMEALASAGVKMHVDGIAFDVAESLGGQVASQSVKATEADWGTEYLDMEISIKCVSGLDEAIAHINRYSTHHSECIISEDYTAVQRFLNEVDSAAVYANASTRFTEGGEFGLGAEIGISTQKLHARGPMGIEALTSSKYILRGNGQVRG
jgi:glutamate-5-semialdehyde dehydrogenase